MRPKSIPKNVQKNQPEKNTPKNIPGKSLQIRATILNNSEKFSERNRLGGSVVD